MSIQLKPGKWKTRDGRVAVVEFRTARPSAEAPWIGYVDQANWFWSGNGKFWLNEREADLDIIAPYTEPRLRPWKPEEVPVGALIRRINFNDTRGVILGLDDCEGVCDSGVLWPGKSGHMIVESCDTCMRQNEHSIDGGKTWLPCGVMEDGE